MPIMKSTHFTSENPSVTFIMLIRQESHTDCILDSQENSGMGNFMIKSGWPLSWKKKKQCIAFAKPATLSCNYFVKYSDISISHTHTQKKPKSGYMWECSQFCSFFYSRDPKAQCPSSSSIKQHPASMINYLLHGKCTLFNLTTGQLCTNYIPSTSSAVPPIPVPVDCLQAFWLSRMTCMVPLTLRPCFLCL